MRRVILESPFAGPTDVRKANITYLRAALRDSLLRGEAPFASHAIYTQHGVIDDDSADERARGIEAGLAWGAQAKATVVYVDRGISLGMRLGIANAVTLYRLIEVRAIQVMERSLFVAREQVKQSIVHLCCCGHASVRHDTEGCRGSGEGTACECVQFQKLFPSGVPIDVKRERAR